ncbi:hypothetical protein TBLA_0H02710 [Henningerozyma blattae CBS 6284]|uniref:Nucleoporin Nup133/Nup155-like C-terminal domain-containing protein n=1 Tax=Henningerozyma blattae (strain ATCC 34711 / CBS 6284 / DSM 70876 / NBRC 10599 / NRRL Y-10934 / UCD 77-7) TaxID=1071380 RepID=I2H853_HENB6|nr:hypothetical protein TBLA_0H02710 [Tetrapisispora blattae CBS 6284]CCH62555.1 hypothetical protein TBLA_0H02710 [Tetrapisispora blattae CBS 6284]
MSLLSKLDVNLDQFHYPSKEENIINLHLNHNSDNNSFTYTDGIENEDDIDLDLELEESISNPISKCTSNTISHDFNENYLCDYSNIISLINGQYISYQLSHDFSTITISPLSDPRLGKTINIFLPSKSINRQHTINFKEDITSSMLTVSIILKNGQFLFIELPIEYILNKNDNSLNLNNYFKLLKPYDFTIRIPNLMHSILGNQFLIVFEDGGLLNLKWTNNLEMECFLFNDNSYLKSLTNYFSRKKTDSELNRAVSCLIYQDKILLILTKGCQLKIWDLEKFTLLNQYDLSQGNNLTDSIPTRSFENIGKYLINYQDILIIFLPFANGVFQIGKLEVNSEINSPLSLTFESKNIIPAKLSTTSIWSLIDIQLNNTLELNHDSDESFLNLVILWKSGNLNKLQILSINNTNFKNYEWIESINKTINDLEIETFIANQNSNKRNSSEKIYNPVEKLKKYYSDEIVEYAENFLSANNITNDDNNLDKQREYFANLATILKDLKVSCDEGTSLTIYQDDIILINTARKWNYGIYKINVSLENMYYNIYNKTGNENEISRYLRVINGFVKTLPSGILPKISEEFIELSSKNKFKQNSSANDVTTEMTKIFKEQLEGKFELGNLQLLFNELETFDNIVEVLNNLIGNYLIPLNRQLSSSIDSENHMLIDSIIPDDFSKSIIVESLNQLINIQNAFILQILITFTFLEFSEEYLLKQIEKLIQIYSKQKIFMRLYEINKGLLIDEVFQITSKYGKGIKISSYGELFYYLEVIINNSIINYPKTFNPFIMKFFEAYVLCTNSEHNDYIIINELLETIIIPFSNDNNLVDNLLIGMNEFQCGDKYEKSFFKFTEFKDVRKLKDILPECLRNLSENEFTSTWKPLIESFSEENYQSKYMYELSCLFTQVNQFEFGLKCIKESIGISMTSIEIDEPLNFKQLQYKQYLDILMKFNLNVEIIEVLKSSSEYLNTEIRSSYYKTLLLNYPDFFSTLLKLCRGHNNDGLYLPLEDYEIVDSILISSIDSNSLQQHYPVEKLWSKYKKIYCLRIVNNRERSAAEILMEFASQLNNDILLQKKCLLIVSNILNTFDHEDDKWLLNSEGEIITYQDISSAINKI